MSKISNLPFNLSIQSVFKHRLLGQMKLIGGQNSAHMPHFGHQYKTYNGRKKLQGLTYIMNAICKFYRADIHTQPLNRTNHKSKILLISTWDQYTVVQLTTPRTIALSCFTCEDGTWTDMSPKLPKRWDTRLQSMSQRSPR